MKNNVKAKCKEYIEISGKVKLTLTDKDGNIKETVFGNMVLDNGLMLISKCICCAAGNTLESLNGRPYIALGEVLIGAPCPNPQPEDLLLNNELPDINVPRVVIDVADVYRDVSTVKFDVTFGLTKGNPTSGYELSEVGLFWNNATLTRETGTMMARALVLPRLVKTPFKLLHITWSIYFRRKPAISTVLTYP